MIFIITLIITIALLICVSCAYFFIRHGEKAGKTSIELVKLFLIIVASSYSAYLIVVQAVINTEQATTSAGISPDRSKDLTPESLLVETSQQQEAISASLPSQVISQNDNEVVQSATNTQQTTPPTTKEEQRNRSLDNKKITTPYEENAQKIQNKNDKKIESSQGNTTQQTHKKTENSHSDVNSINKNKNTSQPVKEHGGSSSAPPQNRSIQIPIDSSAPLIDNNNVEVNEIPSTGFSAYDDYIREPIILRESKLSAPGNPKARFVWWGSLKRMQVIGAKNSEGLKYYPGFGNSNQTVDGQRHIGYLDPGTIIYAKARKYEVGTNDHQWYLFQARDYGDNLWIRIYGNNLTLPETTGFTVLMR